MIAIYAWIDPREIQEEIEERPESLILSKTIVYQFNLIHLTAHMRTLMSWLSIDQIPPDLILYSVIGLIISVGYALNHFDLLHVPGFGRRRALTQANNEDQERQKIIATLAKLQQENPRFDDMSADELLIIAARNSISNVNETTKVIKTTRETISLTIGIFMLAITLMPWFAADKIQSGSVLSLLMGSIIFFYVINFLFDFDFRRAATRAKNEEQERQKIIGTLEKFRQENPRFDKMSADELLIIAVRNSFNNAKENAKILKIMDRDTILIMILLMLVTLKAFGFK